jgi:hypothetical protein
LINEHVFCTTFLIMQKGGLNKKPALLGMSN